MDKLRHFKVKRTQLRRTYIKTSNEVEQFFSYEKSYVLENEGSLNELQVKSDRLFKLNEEIETELMYNPSTKNEDLESEFASTESYQENSLPYITVKIFSTISYYS